MLNDYGDKIMISISSVFEVNKNLILVTNDKHNYKVGDIIIDQNQKKYKIIGVVFQTNDLYVEPLFKYNKDVIKSVN